VSLSKAADALLRRATDGGDIPGVVALVTNAAGPIYEGAFGLRALGQSAPMTHDTVVWIASMTKALVSAAALQLLDRPVADDVPELAQVQVLEGFDPTGRALTRPPARAITLRHLLTHTAGFGYEYWSAPIQQYRKTNALPGIASCRNRALQLPLLFDPGERWEYGIGTDWLGKVVEAASGQRLGQYLDEHLLAPLGMHDTAFEISVPMRARLAKVHQRGRDGSLAATAIEVPQAPEFEMGGGGLYGTGGDYLKFVRMILNGGRADDGRVLEAATVAAMAHAQTGALTVHALKTVMPALSNDLEFFPGIEKHFGFGFQVNAAATDTGLSAGGLMWAGLANTYYWIDPARRIGGVYLTQILPFADVHALPLFLDFQRTVYETLGA
jgi:methyl acetate hydrolase